MLSAVIQSRHSYGAVLLAKQPPDQRSVHSGPLVLGTKLLKNQRLQQIKTNLSHAYICTRASYSLYTMLVVLDYIFILSFT